MTKAAKRAIHAVIASADFTDEELMTAFARAEALINSRPLTYQSANPNDDVLWLPNHFLHGNVGGLFAPKTVDTTDGPTLKKNPGAYATLLASMGARMVARTECR